MAWDVDEPDLMPEVPRPVGMGRGTHHYQHGKRVPGPSRADTSLMQDLRDARHEAAGAQTSRLTNGPDYDEDFQ